MSCLRTGVDGVKVKVFTTSMDTKGREELLGVLVVGGGGGCVSNFYCDP